MKTWRPPHARPTATQSPTPAQPRIRAQIHDARSEEARSPCSGSLLQLSCRVLDCGPDLVVGATAANVAAHRGVDIGIRGLLLRCQQRAGAHDLAGLTVATLRHVVRHPCRLYCAPGSGPADCLDRGDAL